MDTVCLDGKKLSAKIKEDIRKEITEKGYNPGLAVVIVGNDPSSNLYVSNKEKACAAVGINSFLLRKTEECTEEELLTTIQTLNNNPAIDGIIVQLPLPKHINAKRIIDAISPNKDVDCLGQFRFGEVFYGDPTIFPCTPSGIMALIHEYRIPLEGKRCTVIGRSNIVGKPMAEMLIKANATVTVCHRHTRDLISICKESDVIISATGQKGIVTEDMINDGVVLIDAGIIKGEDGKFYGDINGGTGIASYATPVPGGVGPMTVAMLLQNTLTLHKESRSA